jgi:hypothetical protein
MASDSKKNSHDSLRNPKIGDKVAVQTHSDGKKICVVDSINNEKIHFKNRNFGLEVNLNMIFNLEKPYRGANFFYQSIN